MPRADEHAMRAGERREQELIEESRSLPADKLAEVEAFVDFLRERQEDRRLAKAATGASEAGFAKVWDDPKRDNVTMNHDLHDFIEQLGHKMDAEYRRIRKTASRDPRHS